MPRNDDTGLTFSWQTFEEATRRQTNAARQAEMQREMQREMDAFRRHMEMNAELGATRILSGVGLVPPDYSSRVHPNDCGQEDSCICFDFTGWYVRDGYNYCTNCGCYERAHAKPRCQRVNKRGQRCVRLASHVGRHCA